MPTQQFSNSYLDEADQHGVYVAWDFAFEHVYLSAGNRTFQIHDLDELRGSGVHVPTDLGELFVYLGASREGETFQVSIDEQALRPMQVDYATVYSPDRPMSLATSTTANLSAPNKTRWKMQERVETGRRWCRVFAVAYAALAFVLTTRTPADLAGFRREGLVFLAGTAVLLLFADLMSRYDNGARFVMLLVIVATPILMLASCFTWLQFGLGLLEPKTFILPAVVLLQGTLAFLAAGARSAGGWLARDDKERRRPKFA